MRRDGQRHASDIFNIAQSAKKRTRFVYTIVTTMNAQLVFCYLLKLYNFFFF